MPTSASALKMKDFSRVKSFNAQDVKSEKQNFNQTAFLNTTLTIWNVSKKFECFLKCQMIKNKKTFLKKRIIVIKMTKD